MVMLPIHAQPQKIERDFLVTGVRVFDGERTLEHVQVAVTGGIVRAVGAHLAEWQTLPRLDGAGATLLPGLIDAHVHVDSPDGPDADLRQALPFGVTTALDMMALEPKAVFAARERSKTASDMSELRSAGFPATAPGGHGTQLNPAIPTLSTAAEARRFVEQRRSEGSDYLKIALNGVRAAARPEVSNLDASTVTALVAAAHAHTMLAVAHVETLEDVTVAVAAGVDGLVHVWRRGGPNAEMPRQIAAQRMFVVTTLSAPGGFVPDTRATLAADARLRPYFTSSIKAHLSQPFTSPTPSVGGQRAVVDAQLAVVRTLHELGVKILTGSDAASINPTMHGVSVHREMELLGSAGLEPTDVLAAATANAADAFRMGDRAGSCRVAGRTCSWFVAIQRASYWRSATSCGSGRLAWRWIERRPSGSRWGPTRA
jgi:imidazolonepropionase-like amidohydrolase